MSRKSLIFDITTAYLFFEFSTIVLLASLRSIYWRFTPSSFSCFSL